MNLPIKKICFKSLLLILGLVVTPIASAHLMVAQHGTLNFLNTDVYMVLSLPASAFGSSDEDGDGMLSISEFSSHRLSIIESINAQVKLSTNENVLPIAGLLVSPVAPHDDPKAPAEQIVVMGRFVLDCSDCSESELTFQSNLFGNTSKEQEIEITANRKSNNDKQVFKVTPKVSKVRLEFN